MADKIKLLAAGLLVAAGIAGFTLIGPANRFPRAFGIGRYGAAAVVVWLTEPGKQFLALQPESVVEARKVVWPTRKETMQMTGVVAFVIVMALFLWLVDGALTWLVKTDHAKG
jgi:preprotein translocase subunit SecE